MRPARLLTLAILLAAAATPARAQVPYYRLANGGAGTAVQGLLDALFAKPFASTSAWNASVPASASFADVPGIAGYPVGLSTGLGADGVSIPVYRAASSTGAGTYKVLYNVQAWNKLFSGQWKPSGNPPDIEAQILASSSPRFPFPYQTFVSQSATGFVLPSSYTPIQRLPDGTAPPLVAPAGIVASGNMDGHMSVYQPDGRVYETYATIVLSNQTVVCLSFQLTDPSLPGDGYQNGVTASMIPSFAGLIRKSEAASLRIDHAMKVLVPASMLAPSFVYPALSFDRGAMTENPPYSGTVPMGSRLAIPAGVDLSTLGLRSGAGQAIAAAAQKYGFIVVDRGGGGVTLVTEAGAAFPQSDGLDSDLKTILAATRRVAP